LGLHVPDALWDVLQLYPTFAKNSPFLLDSLDSYFLGGIDDMATWSDNIWKQTITMLVNGSVYAYITVDANLYVIMYVTCVNVPDIIIIV